MVNYVVVQCCKYYILFGACIKTIACLLSECLHKKKQVHALNVRYTVYSI